MKQDTCILCGHIIREFSDVVAFKTRKTCPFVINQAMTHLKLAFKILFLVSLLLKEGFSY